MGVEATGDRKMNILYYFKTDNARLFQYYEKQTFTLDHLARTCPRKFYYFLNMNLDRGMRMVQMEDLKRERENIQRKYIHYAFSTNNEKQLL